MRASHEIVDKVFRIGTQAVGQNLRSHVSPSADFVPAVDEQQTQAISGGL